MSPADLATEIAAMLWDRSLEAARGVYALPARDRSRALLKMCGAVSLVDRHAAMVVDGWIAEERTA